MKHLLLFVLIALATASCKKDDPDPYDYDQFIGSWTDIDQGDWVITINSPTLLTFRYKGESKYGNEQTITNEGGKIIFSGKDWDGPYYLECEFSLSGDHMMSTGTRTTVNEPDSPNMTLPFTFTFTKN